MSLLKKLFKRSGENPATNASTADRPLEGQVAVQQSAQHRNEAGGASAPAQASPPRTQMNENRDAPRFKVLGVHDVVFRLGQVDGALIDIRNLSRSGIGFIRRNLPKEFSVDEEFAGVLSLRKKDIPAKMKVIHLTRSLVGCQFVPGQTVLENEIVEFLKYEIAALEITKVNPQFMKKDPRGPAHWYRAEYNCELYYVEDGSGELLQFRISIFGNTIDGGRDRPVTLGVEQDESDSEKLSYKGSQLLQVTATLPREIAEGALRFIESIKAIPAEVRRKMNTQIISAMRQDER